MKDLFIRIIQGRFPVDWKVALEIRHTQMDLIEEEFRAIWVKTLDKSKRNDKRTNLKEINRESR